jgi:hypothetical protein
MEKVYLIVEMKYGPEHLLQYYEVIKATVSYEKACEAILVERDKLLKFHIRFYQHLNPYSYETDGMLKRWSDKTVKVYTSSDDWKEWEQMIIVSCDHTLPYLTIVEAELI